jgi:hypothetical protein
VLTSSLATSLEAVERMTEAPSVNTVTESAFAAKNDPANVFPRDSVIRTRTPLSISMTRCADTTVDTRHIAMAINPAKR